MQIEKHLLGKGPENFVSYIIENSEELQPGKKRPAVVICPGGGYLFLSDREAEPIALQFLSRGWQAFIVNYHCGTYDGTVKDVAKQCVIDVAETVLYMKRNAEALNIDPDKIAIIGFSAGGHLSAMYSNNWHTDWLKEAVGAKEGELEISAAVLAYPVISVEVLDKIMEERGESWDGMKTFVGQMNTAIAGREHPYGEKEDDFYYPEKNVSAQTPPTYICHAADDGLIYVQNSLMYGKALADHQIPFEMHIFEQGGHGYSLANEYTANDPWHINPITATWVSEVFEWMKYHIVY